MKSIRSSTYVYCSEHSYLCIVNMFLVCHSRAFRERERERQRERGRESFMYSSIGLRVFPACQLARKIANKNETKSSFNDSLSHRASHNTLARIKLLAPKSFRMRPIWSISLKGVQIFSCENVFNETKKKNVLKKLYGPSRKK